MSPDILALPPRMRATMAAVYREIEAENRRLHAESRAPRHLQEDSRMSIGARSVYRPRKMLTTGLPRRFGCFGLACKDAQMRQLTLNTCDGFPSSLPPVPGHSSVCRSFPARAYILGLLRRCNSPQIVLPVIKSIAVNMVTLSGICQRKSKQLSVHQERVRATILSLTGASGIPIAGQVPRPLAGPLGVTRVNDGICSDRSIKRPERNTSGSVCIEDRGLTGTSASHRTKPSGKRSGCSDHKSTAASGAIERNAGGDGTFHWHRMLQSLGVLNADVATNNVSISFVNYTMGSVSQRGVMP